MPGIIKPALAAERLGISPRGLRLQLLEGRLPGSLGFRVGRLIRYDVADLDAYLEAQKAGRPRGTK